MDEFEMDDSLDTSFSDDSSLDSYESSGGAIDVMDSAEVPAIEDTSFDSIESGNIDDYSYEDTEFLTDEVSDVMNDVEVEELTFDDEPIEDTSSVEIIESEMEQPEETPPDLIETMDNVETEVLEFEEQVEEPYEATPNSEIEILQEDGTVDTLQNIQEQLEAEPETAEQMEEPYEATPNSEIEILQEDGTVGTLENIQEQLEAEPETAEQMEEPYEATPNLEIEILQEDGTVDTLENIQEQLEAEPETAEQMEEPYEATPNSEIEILQEDGTVDTLQNIQEPLEAEPETAEQMEEPYEATPNSEIEILQEDGTVDTLENIQEQLEAEPETAEQMEEPYEATPNSEIEILQEDGTVDTLENIQEPLEAEPETAEQMEEPYEATPNSEIEMLQEDGTVDMLENIQEQGDGEQDNFAESVEIVGSSLQTEEIQEQLDPHEALSNMSEYMNAHNYGMEDYETYSKDPEWQALNKDLQVANGMEPTEYVEEMPDSMEIQEQLDPHEALSNMSEYMNAHNYGMEDYETYSKDPEWQALNRDLQIANGIEPTEQVNEELQEASSEIVQREFDDFEQSVLEYNPEFYETGSYYEQGVNEFGFQGTCGPTSQANAINQLLGTNELTENKVLSVAIDNNLCQTHGALDSCGGTSTEQFMELYDKMNEQLGDRFETELFEYDNVLDANQVAERLESGDVINVAVDACALWDQPRDYTNAFGVRQDDFYSDHWITVTGVERMEDGGIRGFDIIDSGGGESYVSLDKYNDMCFGTDEHRVIDPTCIVLSRKEGIEQYSSAGISEDINSIPENDTNVEMNKRPSLIDGIFHRKGE